MCLALTQPLVWTYGESFLQQGIMNVLFLKPACQDDLLNIPSEYLVQESCQRSHLTSIFNEDDKLLAELESWLPDELPPVNPLANMQSGPEVSKRPKISWEVITIHKTYP